MYPFGLAMNSLPSPPETNITLGPLPPGSQHRPLHSMLPGHDNASVAYAPSLDGTSTPLSRLRRQPSIVYHSPSHRSDARERAPSNPGKLLVVVVPPVSLREEHGNFGSTLSVGPLHRLSQGIIMPLFPNMYSQLSAIAKEFNFPSITGLCLYYYYYNDASVVLTPRISEETWTTIWGLSDPLSSARERRPPIAGKLEFDIDYNHARWYNSWLTSRQGDSMDYPLHPGVSSAPLHHQQRSGNRFTFPQRETSEDFSEPVQQRSAPIGRHVPRKLSLVERYDNNSVQDTENSGTLLPVLNPLTAKTGPVSSHILSPIKQLEEPKSARLELDHKVNTWRAAAIASPEPIEEVATLEPATVPENGSPSTESFHLEDYQWSISSHGPDDGTSVFYESDYRTPSVHLCDRVNGSVASTASYCTSPGPSDSSVFYAPSAYSYPYSPDIAYRMIEDSPLTPLTATSWGAPSHYADSLSSQSYQPSIDIALRACFSRPSTPGTATSWGPQSDDGDYVLESPGSSFSVHLGDRGEFSRPITPQTATSWGAPSYPDSPMSPYRLPTPDIAHRTFEDVAHMVLDRWPGRPWRHAWPYNVKPAGESNKWAPAISKIVKQNRAASLQLGSSSSTRGYPFFDLYPAVEPRMSLSESGKRSEEEMVQTVLRHWPGPWRHAWPYNVKAVKDSNRWVPIISKVIKQKNVASAREKTAPSTQLDGYPHNLSQIYKAQTSVQRVEVTQSNTGQYPFLEIYPAVFQRNLPVPEKSKKEAVQSVLQQWPGPWRHAWPYNIKSAPDSNRWATAFSKVIKQKNVASARQRTSPSNCLDGYPHNLSQIYKLQAPVERAEVAQMASGQYPFFEIYPAVYPFNVQRIYPNVVPRRTEDINSTAAHYPFFELYPAVYPFNLELIYPAVPGFWTTGVTIVVGNQSHTVQYPFFDLYPAVYPFNVERIYPVVAGDPLPQPTKAPALALETRHYPFFDLYPAVYPFNVEYIYPIIPGNSLHQATRNVGLQTVHYPLFNLYPAVYPFNLEQIYPVAPSSTFGATNRAIQVSNVQYPFFDLYPAVYPFNLERIYLQVAHPPLSTVPTIVVTIVARYPFFELYPAVYPYNLQEIYPNVPGEPIKDAARAPTSFVETTGYPWFNIYPAVYPFFDLYPTVAAGSALPSNGISLGQRDSNLALASYPFFVLYPAVYPDFDLYPSAAARVTPVLSPRRSVLSAPTCYYPYLDLYPSVYPHFDLWPSLPPTIPSETSHPVAQAPPPRALRSSLTDRPPLQPLNIPLPPIPVASPPATSKPSAAPTPATPGYGSRRRSGRLTHAELHAMVLMGTSQNNHKLWMGDVLESFPAVPMLARSTSVTRSPSRSPVNRNEKTDVFDSIPPVPSLSRSSSVSLTQRSPGGRNGRISAFPSSTQREALSRSLSTSDQTGRIPLAQRRSMWEGISSVPAPPIRQVRPITMMKAEPTKRRDSVVLQRVKAYTPPTSVASAVGSNAY
ncbi:hypothetical protein FA15DRAFT_670675 [Coprinopsis marcescibilis]|uniref:Uncharacterized protein n=1 Tax=Coprinopsis marcescibilis TaxID=230819 RepID=A0A5C3KRN4_COPMA|nr:hypothetical protein FA15DRAFT_670675 [Coprinopsis marcescibilis]